MGKLATTAIVVGGGVGTLLVAAAQTKPEDARSNLAGWLKEAGAENVPDVFTTTAADTFGTVVGGVLVIGALGLWSWRRYRRQAKRVEADMPLHLAVRWLVQHSIWAAEFPCELDQKWVSLADREFQAALSTGRLTAWGYFKPNHGDAEVGPSEIPQDYWRKAQWNSHNMASGEPPTHVWRNRDDGGGAYRRVVLDPVAVRAMWPKRSWLANLLQRSPIERLGKRDYGGVWKVQDAYYKRLRNRPPYGFLDEFFEPAIPSRIDEDMEDAE